MSRRPALDGLRAIAVLAVMAFHTSPAAHGGFIGVDVFFVVSGYLITHLLLAERVRTGRIDLKAFYVRRALRLAPALLLMLAVALPLMLTSLRDTLGISAVAAELSALFYVANWVNVAEPTITGPITHTWSLSIEEQFYLLWPVILIFWLTRYRRAPATGLAAVIGLLVVARWLIWESSHGFWLYYATISHCDGLLLGALLAIVLFRRSGTATTPRWSEPAAWAGLAGLGVLALVLYIEGDGGTYTYGLAAAAVCSAAVVHHLAVADSGPLVRLLSIRPLVVVGMVSYGLYLFHFPVFQAVQHAGFSRLTQHGLELVLTVALTVASWFLVEKPALRLKDRFGAATRQAANTRMGPGAEPAADTA